jgi:hypothetical protein
MNYKETLNKIKKKKEKENSSLKVTVCIFNQHKVSLITVIFYEID